MKKFYFPFIILLLLSSYSYPQFQIKAELRPRLELRNGYGALLPEGVDPAFSISQRTRLALNYQVGKIQMGFTIQDFRTWGDENLYTKTGIAGDTASLDLDEAWLGFSIYRNGSLKIGRQYLVYEDERFLSRRNWGLGVKYDALLFKHASESFKLDIGLSYNASGESFKSEPYPDDKLKTLNFIYFNKPLNDWLNFSLMALATGFNRDDTSQVMFVQGTYGAYLNVKKKDLTATASGFYQNGNSRYETTSSAYMFSLKGSYKTGKFNFGAGIDYISGQDASNDDDSYKKKDHFFDILYGNRHSFYGHLDLFNNMREKTGQGGLVDPFVNFKYQLAEKATLLLDLHYFWTQSKVADISMEEPGFYLDKALGSEFDFGVNWDIYESVNLRGGYSMFFPTKSMEVLQKIEPGDAKNGSWVWLMITFNPTLLDTGKKKD